MPVQTRRALLFMPGDDRHKIEKGATLGADSIIMDLEDGVALNNKAQARAVTNTALRELDFGQTERLVRINPVLPGGLHHADFFATVDARPDGYVIPKVEAPEQIQDIASWLTRAEAKYGWPDNSIMLIAIIETALGVVNLHDIARASVRLRALAFGAEDLAADMGAVRSAEGREVFYARSAVVLHAKANGLQAIDTPFVNLNVDDALLTADTEGAMRMGYTGKFAIHPRQVHNIQQVFTPTATQIDDARRLIEAHDAEQTAGSGVFVFEGRMVDMPMVRSAQSILERARAAGLKL